MSTDSQQIDPAVRQFAELAAGGIAVPSGLDAAAAETGDRTLKKGLKDLAERLRRGADPESASLSDVERLIAALVAEKQSNVGFSDSLTQLAGWQHRTHDLRRSLAFSIAYPVFLIICSLASAAIIGRILVPGIEDVLLEFEIDIPADVQGMVWWHKHVWGIFLGLAIAFATCALLLAFLGPRAIWYRFSRYTPVLGEGLAWLDTADMCRHVGNLLCGASTYPVALRTARAGVESPDLKAWLMEAASSIDNGGSLQRAAYRLPRNSLVLSTLINATTSGGPDEGRAWTMASRYFYRIGKRRIELSRVILPFIGYLIVLVVGASVIFGMLAPLSSLFTLINSLSGW